MTADGLIVREAGDPVAACAGRRFDAQQVSGLLSSDGLVRQGALDVFKSLEE